MELEAGIKKVLDGEGVLFLGSGFSLGGKNSNNNNLETGAGLSHKICEELAISESDNLVVSASRYLKDDRCKKTLGEFIDFLSKELYCTEVTSAQKTIAQLPWNRIYTTNYDNAFELASEQERLVRNSITITNQRYAPSQNLDQAIIHINGSVLHLNEKSFYDEFKITDESYTKKGLLQSDWKQLFESDLSKASVVFFIGYSLDYDQELVSFLANLEIQDKCIFIDVEKINADNEFRISGYGKLSKIGTEGFANHIKEIAKVYTPQRKIAKLQGFEQRKREDYYSEHAYTPIDMTELFIKGNINRKYINQTGYCIRREETVKKIAEELKERKIIVIESKLGNGKSVLLECIGNTLIDEYNVFYVKNLDNMNDDLNLIQRNFEEKSVFLIDDYGNYIPLIRDLGRAFPENIKIVMTCRSSINSNLYFDLVERYGYSEEDLRLFNVDELTDSEINEVVTLFNHNRLWGKYDTYSNSQKKKLLSKNYKKQTSRLFYLLLKSSDIRKNIEEIVDKIKKKKGLFDFVLIQSINNLCGLKFGYSNLLEFAGISDSLLRSYLVDKENVGEILSLENNRFMLSSSIFSRYLVRETKMRMYMLDMLGKMFEECSKNDEKTGRFY